MKAHYLKRSIHFDISALQTNAGRYYYTTAVCRWRYPFLSPESNLTNHIIIHQTRKEAGGMSFIIRSDWIWRCPGAVGQTHRSRGSASRVCPSSSLAQSQSRPLRYAVLGAGFAGLSVVWHLLKVKLITLRCC